MEILEKIISNGLEGRSLEFKASFPMDNKIAKTAIAFSNGVGGKIIFGVRDTTREVVGIEEQNIFKLEEQMPIHLAEEIINSRELTPLTEHTITDVDEFWKELRTVAKQNYAVDHKESAINGSCISVAIRDPKGTPIAALSFSGFIGIENQEELIKYLPILHDASSEISKNLYKYWKD